MSGEQQIYGRKGKFSLIGLLVVLGILSGTWQPKIAIRLPMGKERSARIEMKGLEESLQFARNPGMQESRNGHAGKKDRAQAAMPAPE